MHNYLGFPQTSFLFNTSEAINSIISFQLSQMCKAIQAQLQYQLLRNEFLRSKIYVPAKAPPVDLSEPKQAKVQVEKKTVKKTTSCSGLQRILSRKRVFECKIETKNLPKNFGKAIITYIQNNPSQIIPYLSKDRINYEDFVGLLMEKRSLINTIQSLRDLWLESKFPYSKQMRELSMYFLRKHCFKYIFNSRIKNMPGHVKYRKRLLEALERPHEFTSIKTLSYKWPISKNRK